MALHSFESVDNGIFQEHIPSPRDFNSAAQNATQANFPSHESNQKAFSPDGIVYSDIVSTPGSGFTDHDEKAMTEAYYQSMQDEISKSSSYALPSRKLLCGFIKRYFRSFHRHQPFLHEPTWSPNESPFALVLAICANGAVYNLEYCISQDLYAQAIKLFPSGNSGLTALQTMMPLIAYAAWAGERDDLCLEFPLYSRICLTLGREWSLCGRLTSTEEPTWKDWREMEALRRVTYCILTVLNLIAIAYDLMPPIKIEEQYGMPSSEALWTAASEQEWNQLFKSFPQKPWKSTEDLFKTLSDPYLPIPSDIGPFGCHVVILHILQKACFLQKLSTSFDDHTEYRLQIFTALERWKIMWENEPEASRSFDFQASPILFNCTALFRLTHVRLSTDFCEVRKYFTFCSEEQIVSRIKSAGHPLRSDQITTAAFQACQSLHIPSQMGFRLVSKTKFWVWSVQHALSYFECALFLSKWLQTVKDATEVSSKEREVVSMVQQMLAESSSHPTTQTSAPPNYIMILYRFAELIDTGETTVWKIVPRMARVLRSYAETLSEMHQTQ
ncbi:hypothetical protein BU24DRAFT_491239 [Aaosphaeria arxii CBS 175.79]|uniref:Xylanolytic transcriptional activator regulatory domain-containing protein n=1 Tax=Aaosphaeria arxii CBS 175.79 TaxID=1450172 RepID=A0A6A5XY33_9PLEO|nr:uncharacterized protein BU24DRAFT_491239 [Aaosphaeria arxii CBS 175.79]KAF2018235.1 hypothetical protein BU24DRAFT_491239 [Aaosphaeria arxii CBS 175.79]